MNIIFFGSDDFALVHLDALLKSRHKVLACVTSPDKPKGRGLKVISSSIKELAQEKKLPVFQPIILDKPFIEQCKTLKSDLFVVIAYGKILPAELLKIPFKASLNVHPSLLPRYRGAAPINWAIINGEKETGLSIIQMNVRLDAGEIVNQIKIAIDPNEAAPTLRNKMMTLGPEVLLKTIDSLEDNTYTLKIQEEKDVTYAPKLTKELGLIDWQEAAVKIHNLVRGLLPWPAAYTFYKNKLLKILSTEIAEGDFHQTKEGEVVKIDKNGFVVATGEGALLVKEVHVESSHQMSAWSFVQGHQLKVGFKF